MDKYKDLVELASRDEGLYVEIVYYQGCKIDEVYLLDLCSENLVAEGKKFYSSMHRIVMAAIESGAEISIVNKEY